MPKKAAVIPLELQSWFDRIHNAEERRKKVADKYGWTRLKQELCGDYRKILGTLKGTPIIPINLVHAFMRTAIPSLYFRDPRFAVNPQGRAYIGRAKVLEPVTNHTWAKLKLKQEIKKCLGDTLLYGHSWMKVGQTAVAGPRDVEAKPKGKKSVEADKPQFDTDQVIKNEQIWAYRVSPWDITFNSDESLDPPYDCRWIAHRIARPLATVKALFPGNDDLQASHAYGLPEKSSDSEQKRANNAGNAATPDGQGLAGSIPMVYLYEVTDMDSRQLFYIADGYNKVLADPKAFPYDFLGYQYSMLKFNPVPDDPYPYGDLYAVEPQIWEITKLISMALAHVKRFGRQMTCAEGSISESEEAKFQQGIDGALIKHRTGANPPMPIPYPPVQADLYNIIDRLHLLFDSIVGQSAFDRGSTTATKTRTLGEVGYIQRATENRSSEKEDIVEDFVEEVAGKLIALKKQFTDVPEFVACTGLNPQELNQLLKPPTPEYQGKMADETGFFFTKEDIQGEYDIKVVAGSMKPLDHQTRNDILIQILRFGQALGLQPGDPASNEIGRELFGNLDMYGVAQAFDQKIEAMGLQADIEKLKQVKEQLMVHLQQLQARGAQMQQQQQQAMANPQAILQQMLGGA